MSLFSWMRGGDPLERNRAKLDKLEESSKFLIDAAVAITDVAGALTDQIRQRYDAEMRFEATSNLIEDALLICEMNGTIQHANEAAERDFGSDLQGKSALKLFKGTKSFDSAADLFAAMQTLDSENPISGRNAIGSFLVNPKLERLDWQNGSS